ncbi:MAG TPA: hypothetical protein VGR27_11780 [Longimicrobiaceae bacterium]|nr:hypothetical protein [Longimicrobiaceae bacterium]
MSAVQFSELPNDARLWVFAAARPLTPQQREMLLARVDEFLEGWLAHGRRVVGGRELRHDRFLLVAADERATGVSGCSIDTLFRRLQELERELGVSLLDSSLVYYRAEDGAIQALPRADFRQRVRAEEVGEETVVFDNTVRSVEEVREGRWELPMRDSWHAQAFSQRARSGQG